MFILHFVQINKKHYNENKMQYLHYTPLNIIFTLFAELKAWLKMMHNKTI